MLHSKECKKRYIIFLHIYAMKMNLDHRLFQIGRYFGKVLNYHDRKLQLKVQ